MTHGCFTSLQRLISLIFLLDVIVISSRSIDLTTLSYYEVVEPQHLNLQGRSRRDISTLEKGNKHLEETIFVLTGHKREFHLQIYKNNFLIPRTFNLTTQDSNGEYVHNSNIEHCYYQGYLRNRNSSHVIISTCNGLRGVIKDNDGEEFTIEPHPGEKNTRFPVKHVLYKNRDIIAKSDHVFECGVDDEGPNVGSHHHNHESFFSSNWSSGESNWVNEQTMLEVMTPDAHHRSRRSVTGTKYIEVVLVIDNNSYKYYEGKDASTAMEKTQQRGLDIMNFVDAYYKTMNTRVVLTNIIVWNVKNMSPVTTSAHETLDGIKAYTRDVLFGQMKLNFDNTQLMIYESWGSLAGLASVGIICSPTSAAVSRDITTAPSTANTIAHEMGHNIGFSHFNTRCSCVTPPCVMDKTKPETQAQSFAPCTKEYYEKKLNNGGLPCLLEYPEVFFSPPVCGNGLLEVNETCDCGTEQECNATSGGACCDFATCQLKVGADCATGPCCEGCKFKAAGIMCRDKLNPDCDIEEYCTGTSQNCPENKFLSDGGPCNNDTSYCYQGMCKTHDTACEFLWGENAKMSEEICYGANVDGTDWANCGTDVASGNITKCEQKDILCGKLQCRAKSADVSLPTFPVIGTSRGRNYKTMYTGGKAIICILGKTTVSPDMGDPTIAPDGVKCGDFKMCINNKCVALRNDTGCDPPCQNGGQCTYERKCLCRDGFLPPVCEAPTTTAPSTLAATTTTASTTTASTTTAGSTSAGAIVTTNAATATTAAGTTSITPTTTSAVTATPPNLATTITSPPDTTNASTTSAATTAPITTSSDDTTLPTTTSATTSVSPSGSSGRTTDTDSDDSELYWLLILLLIPMVVVIVVLAVKIAAVGGTGNKVANVNGEKIDMKNTAGIDNKTYVDFPDVA